MSILVLNIVILCRFHKYSKTRELNDQSAANRQMILQRERKLWKNITIIICAFLFCFMPWFITLIIICVCVSCHRMLSLLMLFYIVATSLMLANSGLNPFLYAWRLPKYRETFNHFLKRRGCCGKRSNPNKRVMNNRVHDSKLWFVLATVVDHFELWNVTSEEPLHKVWLRVNNTKAIFSKLSVVPMLMSPIIVLGNLLVILSVWEDSLKTLHSSPSNFILLSMAVADLLVGSVECPLTVYWRWAMPHPEYHSFLPLLVGSILVDISIGHMLLLTIDRFHALVTPLRYKD